MSIDSNPERLRESLISRGLDPDGTTAKVEAMVSGAINRCMVCNTQHFISDMKNTDHGYVCAPCWAQIWQAAGAVSDITNAPRN